MYSYTYDKNTGGILLNTTPTAFSNEPRPVYAAELDILGFDRYWKYDRQNELPYIWAEANYYLYRGTLVAKLKGGNLYTAPEIIIPTVKMVFPYHQSQTAMHSVQSTQKQRLKQIVKCSKS